MAQYTGSWGSNPAFDWIVDLNEVGRSESSATIRVQLRLKLHGSSSSTFFGYPLNWKCSCLGVDSGWMEVKTAARWYGGQDYRSYTRDLTIPADNGGKTVGVNIKTDAPGYSLSTGEFNWDYNFTISTRNTKPWWTSDDTRMNDIKAHVIIPENWGSVNVKSATAWDSEQGGNLNYDIHRHINGSYNAQIKWGGSGIDVTDNIGSWGQGTRIKYEAKVHDGQGGWADGSRWSWEYTKNTFSNCSVTNVASIDNSSTGVRYDIISARNSGGGNGYVNNNFGYRMECITPGVTMHGNCELGGNGNTINVTVGIDKGSGSPNPHYFKFSELKSYLSDKGYKGAIRVRINCWNSYGSSGSYDFDIPVDLRISPGYTTVSYSADSKITHGGASYYIPAYVPLKCSWNHVQDPMSGGNCSYDILYQVGEGQYVYIDSTSSNSYTAYLGSTPIGNSNQSQFRIIIRAKTSYGYTSDTGAPRIDLKAYSPCSVQISSVTRNKTTAVIAGRIVANTSITGVTFSNSAWAWSSGGSGSGSFSATSGSFSITVNAGQEISGVVRISSSDSVRNEIIKINSSCDLGSANATIKSYVPTMSWRKNSVGINCYPDGTTGLCVEGGMKVNGVKIDAIRGIGKQIFSVGGDANTYYPVLIGGFGAGTGFATCKISVTRNYNWPAPDTWNTATHRGGLTLTFNWAGDTSWGGNSRVITVEEFSETYTTMVAGLQLTTNGTIVWLRGGNAQYQLDSDYGSLVRANVTLGDYTASDKKVYSPRTNVSNVQSELMPNYCVRGTALYSENSKVLTENSYSRAESTRGKIGYISMDGVMEVGRYIDFHYTDGNDYSGRLSVASNGNLIYNNAIEAGYLTVTDGGRLQVNGNGKNILVGTGGADCYLTNSKTNCYLQLRDSGDLCYSGKVCLDSYAPPIYNAMLTIKTSADGNGNGDANTHFGYNSGNGYSHYFRGTGGVYVDCHAGIHTWEARTRFLRSPGGQNLDIVADSGTMLLDVKSQSGCGFIIDRRWGGTQGSESCMLNSIGNGWGFLGNENNKFMRVYSSGGSISSYKPLKYDISKYDNESLYQYVKDMNIYLYRTKSTITQDAEGYAEAIVKTDAFFVDNKYNKQAFKNGNLSFKEITEDLTESEIKKIRKQEIIDQFDLVDKEVKREDLMLGTMIDELPTEVVDYDTEGNTGKTVEIYSYTTMIAGAVKHLQTKIEFYENKIQDLEEKINGIINTR